MVYTETAVQSLQAQTSIQHRKVFSRQLSYGNRSR